MYMNVWAEQKVTAVRLWFHWEVLFFFNWLLSIIVFFQITFWTKAGSYAKDEDQIEIEKNVWKYKKSEDYMRYMKKETFDLCIQITLFVSGLNIILIKDHRIDLYGTRDFIPGGIIITILVIQHGVDIIVRVYSMVQGVSQQTIRVYTGLLIFKAIIFVATIVLFFVIYDNETTTDANGVTKYKYNPL